MNSSSFFRLNIFFYIIRSQSSLDSTNSFAFVAPDLNKDLEQKSMREHRNDINVKHRIPLIDFIFSFIIDA
jgi:hypothetical protein